MTDYYSVLGVAKNASQDDIKKAYRKLASQHHPDKGGDTNKFQQIEEAYRILSDDATRSQYDNPQQQFNNAFHGGNPFEDMFRHFGGFGGFDIFGRQQQPRNRTINLQTTISLEEAFYGKELIANVVLPSGKEQILNVKIPPGIQNSTVLRLAGMGEDTVPHVPRGDIHLTITIAEHDKFHRQGDDLLQELTMPVWSAILGDTVNITTIDNKQLELTIPAGSQTGQTLVAQGYGMPNMNDTRFRGRLLLKLKFVIPTDLTDQQKDDIRKIIFK